MNSSLKQYKFLLQTYLGPLQYKVLFLAIFLSGGIGLQLWTPQILRDFIDLIESGSFSDTLVHLAILFMAATLISQAIRLGAAYLTEDVKWRATNQMRGDLAAHCMALDMSFHNTQTPGKMIERVDGDVHELSNFFSQFIIQVMGNSVLLLGVLVLMFREDWRIGLGFLVFSILAALALSKTSTFAVPLWKARRQSLSEMFGFLEERLSGMEDIRANGGVAYVINGLHKQIHNLFRTSRRAFMIGDFSWGLTAAMFDSATALALAGSAYLLQRETISLGTVYLIFHYSTMLRRPVDELTRQIKDLQSATAGIERIQALFEQTPQVQDTPPSEAIPLPPGPLPVWFGQVDFGYAAGDRTLKEVDLNLQRGEVLGLLGRTGSGKTTLTRLLFRLYDPQAGQIRVGGVPLTQTSLDDLRQRIGIVTQEVQLFQATVRDNLTFFDDSIRDEAILEVIQQLGLGRWFNDLPDGLDSELAAGNGGLSAGEAQLLAFSRVFLKDPGLVILDEASSRLDPATEQLIERAIDRLLHNRTGIIVAHRLATVQRADKIMILEDGQVVEFGDRLALTSNPDSRFAQLLQTGLTQVLA